MGRPLRGNGLAMRIAAAQAIVLALVGCRVWDVRGWHACEPKDAVPSRVSAPH